MKYRILEEDTKVVEGTTAFQLEMFEKGKLVEKPRKVTLYRIEAVKDFSCGGMEIHKGDKGGYIASKRNLAQSGSCWIGKDICALGTTRISGDAGVAGQGYICSASEIKGKSFLILHCAYLESVNMEDTMATFSDCRIKKVSAKEQTRIEAENTRLVETSISDHSEITAIDSSIRHNEIQNTALRIEKGIINHSVLKESQIDIQKGPSQDGWSNMYDCVFTGVKLCQIASENKHSRLNCCESIFSDCELRGNITATKCKIQKNIVLFGKINLSHIFAEADEKCIIQDDVIMRGNPIITKR